jgi:hypothetical protein
MTSKWRKQETFKNNTQPTTKTDNFSNIPMFDVLQNTKDSNTENKSVETPIVEGYTSGSFDWPGIDYFHHHSVFNITKDYSKIREFIEKLMSYFSSPIANVDTMLERFIYDILIACFMLNNKDCANNNNNLSKLNNTGDKAKQMFFWISSQMPKPAEGFSLNEQPYLIKTVDSFEKNHTDFITDNDTKMKVGTYYINSLNSYETKIRRRLTDDELFLFNNDFDNLLNDPNIQNQIKGIVPNMEWHSQFSSKSKPLYQNTEEDYKKFYDTNARFKMDNTDIIVYYKLNDSYFTFPVYTSNNKTTKAGIDIFNDTINQYEYENSLLTRFELNNFNTKNKYSGLSFKASEQNPPNYVSSTNPDMKYIFSIDTNNPISEATRDYLAHVIKYFSLIIFSKLSNTDRIVGFQDIEARVGTIYTNLLNRLDFLQYNQYQAYLDSYRIAIFNHIFFILIQQQGNGIYDNATSNKYFQLTTYNLQNQIKCNEIFQKIIEGNNTRYIKIRSENDVSASMNSADVTNFPSLGSITSSVSDLTTNIVGDTGDLPLSTNLNPFVDNIDANLQNILKSNSLPNYILNSTFKSAEMIKYYMPGQLSECERMKRSVRNEFTNYAKIIKKEIYNLIFIPVVLYIVYNMYYMFFFRDAAGRVKYENGEYINKGFACKNPIFPDWETYFHSYDKHATDYILEYIFKPAKMIYTVLNAFKAIIRTLPLIGIDAQIFAPYVYLFSTILIFKHVAEKHGAKVMAFYNYFFNTWSLPDTKTWNGWKDTARIVTIMFCFLTGVKDIAGFNWHETLQLFAVSADSGLYDPEPKQRSWLGFLQAPPSGMFFLFFKVIIFILYWIFKYYVAIQMIPTALFIAVIYFTHTVFLAVYNNCDSECDYSSKMELIDRIIYTRLYDVPKKLETKDWPLYICKTICWILMVFMLEILIVWTMQKGLHKITGSIGGSKYAEGLKLFLITIYSCIFCLIGLWCFYKFKFKLPIMETFFSKEKDDPEPTKPTESDEIYKLKTGERAGKDEHDNPIKIPIYIFNKPKYMSDMNKYRKYFKIKNAQDKRFTLEKNSNCDTYEILTENKTLRIILGSDILNKIMIKEELEKKKKLAEDNKGKPSFTDKLSGKIFGTMGNIGDRILQKSQNVIENIEKSADPDKPTLFTAVKDIAKSMKSIDIRKTASGAASGAIGATTGAIGATTGAIGSASGAVLTQMKDSTILLKENITGKVSSLLKR